MQEPSKIIPRIDVLSHRKSLGKGFLLVLLKTFALCLFLTGALVIGSLTQTRFSFNWIYTRGAFPLLTCPTQSFLLGAPSNVDGPLCKVFLSYADPTQIYQDPNGRIVNSVVNGQMSGVGVIHSPCSFATTLIDPSKCSLASWSAKYPPSPPLGCAYNVAPVCETDGIVTVGQIINIRGLLVACALILVLYFTSTLIAVLHTRGTVLPNRQRRLDQTRSIADASAKEMTKIIDREWSQMTEEMSSGRSRKNSARSTSRQFPSLVAETGNLRSVPQPAYFSPGDFFESDTWRSRLLKFLGPEAKARRRVSLVQYKLQVGIGIILIYFAMTVGMISLILFALPKVYSTSTPRTFVSALLYDKSLVSQSLTVGSTWLDFLVLADLLTELLFLILSSLIVVQWPQVQVKIPHIVRTRNSIRRGLATDFSQAAADGAIYAETICAVILCRESCTSESRRQSLVKRIQNLLTMFPPDSIFIVDSHGESVVPVDNTWQTVYAISPLIRYCFVPDCDSKFFALHWFNSVWLPYLSRSGQSQAFTHFMVMSSLGDDTPLPAVPLDLSLPRENMSLNMDNLRAIHLPITAVPCSTASQSRMIVPCHDFELKTRALYRLAESTVGSCIEPELSVAIWERDALFVATQNSISNEIGHPNEQLRTGLSVVKQRGRNHTGSNPFTFIPVAVPTEFADMVTFRVTNGSHAGYASQMGQALREFYSVFSLCNVYSWTIKPALLLLYIQGGLIQIMRPFVIGTLVFRDCLTIAFLAGAAAIIIYLKEIVLFLVFSGRSDLRQKWTLGPIVLYPLYRTICTWMIEIPALHEYILGGCVGATSIKARRRSSEFNDTPACPPCHVVNWYTVWKTEPNHSFDEDKHSELGTVDEELSTGFPSPVGVRRGA